MNEEFDIRKIKHPYPSLAYMTEKNKGAWPIPWVSVKGLPDILSKLGDNLVGCEVGTYQGWSLAYLLNNTSNISQIYAIDPFYTYAMNGDVSRAVHEFMKENNIDESLLQFCETDVWYWVKP